MGYQRRVHGQSFEGSDMKNATGQLSFRPVYPTDYHLEKLLRDVGGHTSQIAHVEGFPNMMLYGDRGYNDQEYFEFMAAAALSFLNTTQRGPLLPSSLDTQNTSAIENNKISPREVQHSALVQFAKLVQCSHISLPGGMDSDVLPSSNHLILT